MKTIFLISELGQMIGKLSGDEKTLKLNTQGKPFTEIEPPNLNAWWDFETEKWIEAGLPPSKYHTFNYTSKAWEDERSLDEVQNQKWDEIKRLRDLIEYGGFKYQGNTYDSTLESQARISSAVSLGIALEWADKENNYIPLTSEMLKELQVALGEHVKKTHELCRAAREKIFSAKSKEEVNAVTLDQ